MRLIAAVDIDRLSITSTLGVIMVLYAAALAVYRAFAAGGIHETVEHYKMNPTFFSTLALVVSVPFCALVRGACAYTVVLPCVPCAGLSTS